MSVDTPLNLRQLRHAVLLADEAHFGRAAARACLSQSAFSRSIAALEADLGLRLFDRGPGFVRLTEAGQRVLAGARRMLSGSADLSRELALLRSGDLGDLAVGAGPYSAPLLLVEAIAALQDAHPGVRVQVEIGQPLVLQQQLLDERLDFMLADLSELPEHAQCRVEPLGAAIGALYVRRQHPLAARAEVTLAELRQARFASVHLPAPISRRLGAQFGADASGCMQLALECESALVLRQYALRQDVVVIAPLDVLALELAGDRLCRLRVPELDGLGARTPLRMELGLVWLRERTPSTAVMLLAAELRRQAQASLLPQ